MKKTISFVIILAILASAQLYAKNEIKVDTVYAIEFNNSMTLDDTINFIQKYKIQVLSVKHEYDIDSETITGGFLLNSDNNLTDEIIKYKKMHNSYLKKRKKDIEEKTKINLNDMYEKAEYSQLDKLNNLNNVRIVEIQFTSPKKEFEKIQKEKEKYNINCLELSRNDNSEVDTINNAKEKKKNITSKLYTLVYASDVNGVQLDNDTWIPTSGTINVSSTGTSARFISLQFKWASNNNLSGFHRSGDNNETLEMDVWFKNDNDQAYFYYNWGAYWSSNQPRAYLDTQFNDGSNPRMFCVGSADAQQFIANKTYYWYIEVDNEYSNSGTTGESSYGDGGPTAIVPQRGRRVPENVYSTWSVFSEQTEANNPPLGYSQFNAPGYKSWSKTY